MNIYRYVQCMQGSQHQKQVSKALISNYIPQDIVRYD